MGRFLLYGIWMYMVHLPTFTIQKSTKCRQTYHTLILWDRIPGYRGGREVYKKRISRRFEVLLEATGYIREVPPESGKLSKSWNETGHTEMWMNMIILGADI